jgi:Protein of unknown function (DUF3060)
VRRPRVATLLCLVVVALAVTSLTGCGDKQAQGCDDGVLTIHKSHVKLSMKGVCDTVVIDGSYVDLESSNANREIVNGDHNKIALVPDTSLTVNGDYNEGQSAEIGTVTIRGDHNNFSFDGAIDRVTVDGNHNYVDSDETISKQTVKGRGNYVGAAGGE